MDLLFLGKGLVTGFSIAAPVGPIGVLCIRGTLAEGRSYGLAVGLGAATADAIYGCVAAFGVTRVSDLLLGRQVALRLVGGLFLCVLGLRTLLSSPAAEPASPGGGGIVRAYVSTFFLTLTNPMTIVSFAALFAGLGVGAGGRGLAAPATFVLGVFTGSALWWILLSGAVGAFRTTVGPGRLRWVNRISGAVILALGAAILWAATPR